ncbi:MAG: lipid-A-disaccharide synthase [Prevotellaceae bacterium]|jgi:lipid-A-disaccharide synthase|nr:lipid-A-disaccharide synthase [Prevotellaceae bacterium]
MPKRVYLIAGEPSGDLLGGRLMAALRRQCPEVEFFGVGGELMQENGLKSLFPISDISVMGFFEVLPRLRLILRRIRQTVADIKRTQPDVVVTIDSWGFVASVLKKLKKEGVTIPKIHYVAPQVWVWKKGRAKTMPQLVSHLMTLLPFEPQLFEKHGLPCTFVGHPVIENTANVANDSAAFRAQHSIPPNKEILCVLPGSRHSELRHIAPILVDALKIFVEKHPNIHLVIPTVEAVAGEVRALFEQLPTPHTIVHGQQARYSAFTAARMAMAASGTVSLELTACGTPHLVAYTFSRLSNFFAYMLVKIKWFNLINILSQRGIIPEFIGDDCRTAPIAAKALEMWESPLLLQQQVADAQQALAKLKPHNMLPSEAAAKVVMAVAN